MAQINKKGIADASKKIKQEQKAFEVVKNDPVVEKVNIEDEHEKEILKILIEFGNEKLSIEEIYFDKEIGEEYTETVERSVAEKLYLDLQEDEIEFANPIFKETYLLLIDQFLNKESFDFAHFVSYCPKGISNVIADLDSVENRYQLHDWKRREIYPKSKKDDLERRVQQIVISIRLKLVSDLMVSLLENASKIETNRNEMEEARDYYELKKRLAQKNTQ